MKSIISFLLLLIPCILLAQEHYTDAVQKHQDNYVQTHEVVTGADRKHLAFFPIDKTYRVEARFERRENSPWFLMETSGTMKKMYRVYGTLTFTIRDTVQRLNVYQSQSLMQTDQYRNYLFIPFTDATSGRETYAVGRYYDLLADEIVEGKVVIDFNKVYNPYCAYVSGVYNCPIPPKENRLSIAIRAGEKAYGKEH
ncbi:MAG TPA: DUF1684 domain-containing protein [Chitinophagaceae bacterium]